ncbi:hypothetical protein ZIOFF_011805 [Zingiber officinale]|uniref:Uncharacterized protein n=1 Tax=Zingiber officinale TaxID=94328 RepID=A0A8J5I6G3_ZINOF|nr:hypothetical protein ZIOFF_011805 [Zingiber officinale]
MRRDVCSGLAFLFYIALLVSMARARCAGARVVSPVVAPAVPSSTSRSVVTDHKNLDPFSSSKRRVPNGADPIHNRRAGKSGRPPGDEASLTKETPPEILEEEGNKELLQLL